jgi:uncharacterized protein YacL (UPF0231 family)
MDYQKFLNQIQRRIKDYLPQEFQSAEVSINKIIKNNDLELDAITIRREGDKIVPQIYLNGYFELYGNGVSMSEILMDISAGYFHRLTPQFKDLPENIMDYEQVKNQISVQLINKEINQNMLRDTPYKGLENTDLAAILKIQVHVNETQTGAIRVTNELLGHWETNFESVYNDALENTIRDNPARIQNIEQIFSEMSNGKEREWESPEHYNLEPYDQYILTNQSGINGASVLLYPEVLQQIADNTGSNFFILPSSIHEVVLMKETGELSAAELQAIVMSANQNAVEIDEKLSDEVYYYDGKEQSLSLATSPVKTAELTAWLQKQNVWLYTEPETERER